MSKQVFEVYYGGRKIGAFKAVNQEVALKISRKKFGRNKPGTKHSLVTVGIDPKKTRVPAAKALSLQPFNNPYLVKVYYSDEYRVTRAGTDYLGYVWSAHLHKDDYKKFHTTKSLIRDYSYLIVNRETGHNVVVNVIKDSLGPMLVEAVPF